MSITFYENEKLIFCSKKYVKGRELLMFVYIEEMEWSRVSSKNFSKITWADKYWNIFHYGNSYRLQGFQKWERRQLRQSRNLGREKLRVRIAPLYCTGYLSTGVDWGKEVTKGLDWGFITHAFYRFGRCVEVT